MTQDTLIPDDLEERLRVLYVWPQSVADHHADILTPRQIEKLYEVGGTADEASQALATLKAERDAAVEESARVADAYEADIRAKIQGRQSKATVATLESAAYIARCIAKRIRARTTLARIEGEGT
jgi:hypothetical protein